ncbi:MAG: hypothetical protein WA799_03685 [Nitrosotalea sp.]
MVKQFPVNVTAQILLCIIPYVWIYAFYRIEKLRFGLVMVAISFTSSIVLQMILPFPSGLIGALLIYFLLPVPFIWKWSNDWNKKFVGTF